MPVDYETCPGIPLIAASERDEGDRQHLPGFDFSILLLFDQHQVLGGMWCADRDHHPAPRFELFGQGGGIWFPAAVTMIRSKGAFSFHPL